MLIQIATLSRYLPLSLSGVHIQEAAETPEGSIQLRIGGTNVNADESVDSRVVSTDSGSVNFGVLYRWVNIIECAIYFAAVSLIYYHYLYQYNYISFASFNHGHAS